MFEYILNENSFIDKPKEVNVLNTRDVYKLLRIRGYDYGKNFQSIQELYNYNEIINAKIEWNDNWITFIDNMLQMTIIGQKYKELYVPIGLEMLRIDPKLFFRDVKQFTENNIFEAIFDKNLNIGVTKGIAFRGLKMNEMTRNLKFNQTFLSHYEFTKYFNNNFEYNNQKELQEYSEECNRLALKVSQNVKYSEHLWDSLDIKENEILLKLLTERMELRENYSINSIMNSNLLSKLSEDIICGAYNNQSFFEPFLLTVYENRISSDINILEINSNNLLMYSDICSTFDVYKYNSNIKYSLLHSSPQTLNFNPDFNVYEWDYSEPVFPSDLTDIQLIIYKDLSVCLQPKNTPKVQIKRIFDSIYNKLNSNGFLLIVFKENITFAEKIVCNLFELKDMTINGKYIISAAEKSEFTLIGNYSDLFSNNLLLFRKITKNITIGNQNIIQVTNNFDDWLKPLQNMMTKIDVKPEDENIWLICNSDPINGLLGFYNCINKEPNGNRIRIIHNLNRDMNLNLLDVKNKELIEIFRKDLRINIIKGKELGFYKYTKINQKSEPILTKHCKLNIEIKGDFSSLKWFERQHKLWPIGRTDGKDLYHIYYSALNFKDIMLASGLSNLLKCMTIGTNFNIFSGRLSLTTKESIIGLEFSGTDENSNRVMGVALSGALATTCISDHTFIWPIPDNWSMEEAATVPVVYTTAYYALIVRGKLRNGEKVLIHSGSGGVGQAAINICLSLNCQLFITIGSEEKKQFLIKQFPELINCHFFSSHEIQFRTDIMSITNGLGVDVVLNSLSDDKLIASLKCLAINGRFLEIGKYDMTLDTKLSNNLYIELQALNTVKNNFLSRYLHLVYHTTIHVLSKIYS